MNKYLSRIMIVVLVFSLALVFVPRVMAQAVQGNAALIAEAQGRARTWDALSRAQKMLMVSKAFENLRKTEGVVIRKETGFYVNQIDGIYANNAELTDDDVGTVLRALAIAFRDFDNGDDPEALIRTELGEERYEASFKNKKAFDELYGEYLARKKVREDAGVGLYDDSGIPTQTPGLNPVKAGVKP